MTPRPASTARRTLLVGAALALLAGLLVLLLRRPPSDAPPATPDQTAAAPDPAPPRAARLHWFIPDGMRCDPDLFRVFQWAREGKLPHIRRLMQRGSWGYSIPTFPSHTPTNFATLLTGAYPRRHGVADGPMHIEGHPLARPAVGGFSSAARKLPAVWSLFEDLGKSTFLLSMPGSTPPELGPGGITVRGRWGGWGADFPSLIFERATAQRARSLARGARLFFLQQELTRFIEPAPALDWELGIASQSEPLEITLELYGATLHGCLLDPPGDDRLGYQQLLLSLDREAETARLAPGEWSDWIPLDLRWNGITVPSAIRVGLIRLDAGGWFRIRVLVDSLNPLIAEPSRVATELGSEIGPMVDFVDNYPPQLIFYPEDKRTFLDEARMSLRWHGDVVEPIHRRYRPDLFLHNIYTPNQMLTSRWWLGYIDPASRRYDEATDQEREKLWGEVLEMYRGLDRIVGEALDQVGEAGLIVLSSDHGALPLDHWVRLNNLFASRGWLHHTPDPATGAPLVDWQRSRVVYLKMYHVYIDPEGLGGPWERASGPAYEELRREVRDALMSLADDQGVRPVETVVRWEEAPEYLDLPRNRVGDLLVAGRAGYGWNEEITDDGAIFDLPLKTGYKQAIAADDNPGLWTPFVIAGPGVKQGHQITTAIRHVDQLPTILAAMGIDPPDHVDGSIITEILQQ